MTDPGALALIVIGAACLVYGFIVRMAGSGTSFYMVWIAAGLACMAGTGLLACGIWRKLPDWVRIGLLGMVLAGMLTVAVITTLIFTTFSCQEAEDVDYLLVLGAQMRTDGPSKALRFRLDRAFDYLEEHPDCLCILSGGQGSNEPVAEAVGMKTYLQGRGINPDRLILEDRSRNTIENIRNSMKLFDPQQDSIGIVTSDFHMYRSLRLAKKQGIRHAQGIPAGSDRLYLPNNVFRENIGVIKDLLAGNM